MRFCVAFFVILSLVCIPGLSQDSITVKGSAERLSAFRFFFKGEAHEFQKENAKSLLVLLQYLYKNNHVRYLVMEFGPDFEFLANKFFETGDDSLLVSENLYFSKEFWEELYEFNRLKEMKDRITVLGFDFNRFIFTAQAFDRILKGKDPFSHAAVNSAFAKIIDWKNITWDSDKQGLFNYDLDHLRSVCRQYKQELEDWLGNDFESFNAIIDNEARSTPRVKRDKRLVHILERQLRGLTDGNFLFNYGIEHVFLDGVGMANILAKKDDFEGMVCSIYPYYLFIKKEKSKELTAMDDRLPEEFRNELKQYPANTLISLEEKQIYPARFRRTQWVMVIKDAE